MNFMICAPDARRPAVAAYHLPVSSSAPLHPSREPMTAPLRSHALAVSGGHVLHVDEHGAADGLPALLLHGGPGSGCSPLLRRFFDPARFRIISVDQRGAGLSRPRGETAHNTTAHLLADLRQLRELLQIDRWLVIGGSWGAALAVAHAADSPHAVAGLLLRALFLARDEDVDWFFVGARRLLPLEWARFAEVAPVERRDDLFGFIADTFAGNDAAQRAQVAVAWWHWEQAMAGGGRSILDTGADAGIGTGDGDGTSTSNSDGNGNGNGNGDVDSNSDHETGAAIETDTDAAAGAAGRAPPTGAALAALIDRYAVQAHYLRHRCWLVSPTLLERCAALPPVPTLLLHGSVDRVCRPAGARQALGCMPHPRLARLQWVDGAGHDPAHPAMAAATVAALDRFAASGNFDPPR